MNKIYVILFFALFALPGFAQLPGSEQLNREDMLPEIELGIKTVSTGNFYSNQGNASLAIPVLNEGDQVLSDFSDSYFLIGARQKLYKGWRGQMVLGFSFPDANSGLGQVFYNQVMALVENKNNIIRIGRTTSQTILGEFNTIRDDDALQYTYVLNPFSNGLNTEDNQYANVLEYTRIFGQRLYVTLHAENYQDFEEPNDYSINGLGGSIIYREPESQLWNRNILREIGFSWNNFLLDRSDLAPNADSNETLTSFIGNATFSILPDPVHFVDFKVQGIYNDGLSTIENITDYTSYTRSRSTAAFGMLRYLNRKLERPNFQIAAGFGYKDFSNTDGNTNQYMAIGNFLYRVGNNFDLIFQYRYNKNNGALQPLLGESQHRVQIGLAYTFNKLFNSQFDGRNSLLNLEHGYIK